MSANPDVQVAIAMSRVREIRARIRAMSPPSAEPRGAAPVPEPEQHYGPPPPERSSGGNLFTSRDAYRENLRDRIFKTNNGRPIR